MADEADRAQQYEQIALAQSLAFREGTGLRPKGACYNCGERLAADERFCDQACEHDYLMRRRMRSQRIA